MKNERFMKTANGGSLNIVGSAKIIISLSPQNEVEIIFQVAENLSTNMLLGLQTPRNLGTEMCNCVNQAVHLEALDLFIPWEPFSSPVYLCLRISEEREIPHKTRVWVPTKIVDDP